MILSEQLKQHEDGGDFGKSLDGLSERAKKLEDKLWLSLFSDACKWGADDETARNHANKQLDNI